MKIQRFPLTTALLTTALFASTAFAQTQLVRGDVDAIQGTNLFRLDCTNIGLVSNTVDLQALHNASRQQDIEYEMQVVNVSAGGQATLNVVSAVQIPEMFGMGNLRFGRSETWEVFGMPGSATAIFVALPSATSYAPFGAAGTWLMGAQAGLFAQGTINALGRFQVRFQMPTIPGLVGTTVSSQALILEQGGGFTTLVITNPGCKDVRS